MMKRLAAGVLLASTMGAAAYNENVSGNAQTRADMAYQSFIGRFWTGTQTGGHLAIINGNNLGPAANPTVEFSATKPILWQYAVGLMVPYTYWKTTGGVSAAGAVPASGGNSDAKARLTAIGTWVKANWSGADMSVCNNATPGSQVATTLDDAAWAIRGMVALYEATGDTTFLTYSKNLIDCMNGGPAGFQDGALMSGGSSHWYDATPTNVPTWATGTLTVTLARTAASPSTAGQWFSLAGFANANLNASFQAASVVGNVITVSMPVNPGAIATGGWYHSGHGKGMDSLSYVAAELAYYNSACAVEGGGCPLALAYFNAARTELDWANTVLNRFTNSNCVQTDSLYWTSVGYGTPALPLDGNGGLCARASLITQGSSVVGLAENMSGAVANALIFLQSNNTSYQTAAQAVASSILSKELDTCGSYLDDRDARIGGFAAYDFAAKVLPLLSADDKASHKNAFTITSNNAGEYNRNAMTGTLSGDFCGPWQGVWTGLGYHPDQLEISAQVTILAIATAGL